MMSWVKRFEELIARIAPKGRAALAFHLILATNVLRLDVLLFD